MKIILDYDRLIIFQGGQTFDTKSFLQYYYYGGMVYAAVKNYERALYFFEIVITTPAMTVSHIMLEAYKKYILISLIINGKVSLEKYTLLCTIRNFNFSIFFVDCERTQTYLSSVRSFY